MPGLKLLNDQPANKSSDRLHFERYLNALETTTLKRNDDRPLVTGLFGPWGCGKSTLLAMLAEKLDALNEDTVSENKAQWIIVKFSPWLYSHEKSLLLPLLVTLAKEFEDFRQIVKSIITSKSSGAIFKTATAAMDALTSGTPLLSSLHNLYDDKKQHILFQEEIAKAVKKITNNNKRLVFLIDDLDRCHDSAQIVNLLEQIKLFLHLDRCLFFIAADREQIIRAINRVFHDSGEAYLEKFMQLSFELPPHHSHDLLRILDISDQASLSVGKSLCEALGNNPRKLKLIWNEAVMSMAVMHEAMQQVQGVIHQPDLDLMLKWLLIKNRGQFADNPYRYLDFEARKKNATADDLIKLRDDFLLALQLKDDKGHWRSADDQRLAVFLWNHLDQKPFGKPVILTLYARASGQDTFYSRNMLENACFEGGDKAQFRQHDYIRADLSGGHYPSAIFDQCYFTGADLRHSVLTGSKFINCALSGVCFDEARLDGVTWENCKGWHQLDTEPVLYETIIDNAAEHHWQQSNRDEKCAVHLMKAYQTIIDIYRHNNKLTDAAYTRLIEKAKAIRLKIYPENNS